MAGIAALAVMMAGPALGVRRTYLQVQIDDAVVADRFGGAVSAQDVVLFTRDESVLCFYLQSWDYDAEDWESFSVATNADLKLGIKASTNRAGDFLVYSDSDRWNLDGDWTGISPTNGRVSVRVNCNTTAITNRFATGDEYEDLVAEIQMLESGATNPTTLAQFDVRVYHDIVQGDEADAVSADPAYATVPYVVTEVSAVSGRVDLVEAWTGTVGTAESVVTTNDPDVRMQGDFEAASNLTAGGVATVGGLATTGTVDGVDVSVVGTNYVPRETDGAITIRAGAAVNMDESDGEDIRLQTGNGDSTIPTSGGDYVLTIGGGSDLDSPGTWTVTGEYAAVTGRFAGTLLVDGVDVGSGAGLAAAMNVGEPVALGFVRTANPGATTTNNAGVAYFGGLAENDAIRAVELLEWRVVSTNDQWKEARCVRCVPATMTNVSAEIYGIKANQASGDELVTTYRTGTAALTVTNTVIAADTLQYVTNDLSSLGITSGEYAAWHYWDGLSTTNSANAKYAGITATVELVE